MSPGCGSVFKGLLAGFAILIVGTAIFVYLNLGLVVNFVRVVADLPDPESQPDTREWRVVQKSKRANGTYFLWAQAPRPDGAWSDIWIQTPTLEADTKKRPCVLIAPFSYEALNGVELEPEGLLDQKPYADSNYIVVTYSLDGAFGDPASRTEPDYSDENFL